MPPGLRESHPGGHMEVLKTVLQQVCMDVIQPLMKGYTYTCILVEISWHTKHVCVEWTLNKC